MEGRGRHGNERKQCLEQGGLWSKTNLVAAQSSGIFMDKTGLMPICRKEGVFGR